jgi:hypothetical protein
MAHTILHWQGFDSAGEAKDEYGGEEYNANFSCFSSWVGWSPYYGYGRFALLTNPCWLRPYLPGGPFTCLNAQFLFGITNNGNTNKIILRFSDKQNNAEQISLRMNWNGSAYDLRIQRNTTILGSIPSFCVANEWRWVSMLVYVDDTAGVVKVRSGFNDQITFTFTGDTQNTTLQAIHAVEAGCFSGDSMVMDDLVISSCSPSDDPMPRYRVLGAEVPTDNDIVACSVFGATNNYQAVSDIPPNGDTSYVYSSTPGTKDTYTRNWTSFTNTPLAVRVEAKARKNDAGIRTLRNILKRGSTEFQGAAQALDSQYLPVRAEWWQDPLSGDAWRPGRFSSANMKLGFKIE